MSPCTISIFVFKKGVHRSDHPINSIASWGKNSKFLTENHGPYSFGYNSPFEKFNKLKVKFLNIGITYGKTCTYVHHLEHLNGINHRFYKAVKGFVFHNKKFRKIGPERFIREILQEKIYSF